MWECLHCGEGVEDVFEVCWRCQANRDGTPSALNPPPRDAEEEEEIAFLNKRYVARDCLRCRSAMKHAGEKGLHEGAPWGGLAGGFRRVIRQAPEARHVRLSRVPPRRVLCFRTAALIRGYPGL